MWMEDPEERRAYNREAQKRYRERHRDLIAKRTREHRAKNRESLSAKAKAARAGPDREKHLQRRRAWAKQNREKLRAQGRTLYAKNPEAQSERWKRYYEKNKRALHKKKRAWEKKNMARLKAERRERYEREKAKQSARYKKWREANPEICRARDQRRLARKRNASGAGWTGKDVKAQYAAQRGKCFYCKKKLGQTYDCDHVIPLAKGGAHCRSNMVLTCPTCNRSKRDTDPQDFAGILL